MGFVSNILEDFESFLVLTLSENKLRQLDSRERSLLALKSSLDYRRTDLVYLVQNGFEWDKKNGRWSKEEDIKYRFRDHALFVAYAPAEDPQIAIAVVAEHGGSGSRAAAPIAQSIFASYFGVEVEALLQVEGGDIVVAEGVRPETLVGHIEEGGHDVRHHPVDVEGQTVQGDAAWFYYQRGGEAGGRAAVHFCFSAGLFTAPASLVWLRASFRASLPAIRMFS